jgi:arginyl-tRNA synthetase
MTDEIRSLVKDFALREFGQDISPVFVRTDETHGDFSCNVAMQLAGKLGKSPREIAEVVAEELQKSDDVKEVNIAGPGFINIRLNDEAVYRGMNMDKPKYDQTILIEYSCPNAFKELHTGHLYQTLIGDSMGRIYEAFGAKVIRTSFGGDVGLHAAKCMWGILQALGGENPDKLTEVADRPGWISGVYVNGSKAYEQDETAKSEIDGLNRKIYDLFESGDKTSDFAKIYYTARQWSYDYFDQFYESIGAKAFDRYYPESETMSLGLEIVNNNRGSVFTESDGAVVLDEAKSGLHTRVFITSAGLPTYETKDLGVIQLERSEYDYDQRIIVSGNDQSQYMQVVFKALELIDRELAAKQRHVANGTVRFGDGQKMSSRLGNVSKATEVIEAVESVIEAGDPQLKKDIALGAVKYSMLKSRVGGDISFDIEQSISTEGNSGPYLQYALVRARSILQKVVDIGDIEPPNELDEHERRLAFKLTEMPDVVTQTIADFSPHHLCTYLYELAVIFNRFYENSRVLDDPRTNIRTKLVEHYEKTLSTGLDLLGIPAPKAM